MKRAGVGFFERSPGDLWRGVLALIVGCCWPMFASGADAPQRLTQAQIWIGASPTPPPDTASWRGQTLPDNWNSNRPGVGGEAWYRLAFDVKSEQLVLSALYIARLSMTGEAYLNGERIGGATRWGEPLIRQWCVPR